MTIWHPEFHQLFCDIVSGKEDSFRIDENEHFLAILDIAPVTKGHTLLLPKRTVLELTELSEEEVISLHRMIKTVSERISSRLPTVGISVLQNGGQCNSVSYLHIHIIPRFDTVSIWNDTMKDLTTLKDVHANLRR